MKYRSRRLGIRRLCFALSDSSRRTPYRYLTYGESVALPGAPSDKDRNRILSSSIGISREIVTFSIIRVPPIDLSLDKRVPPRYIELYSQRGNYIVVRRSTTSYGAIFSSSDPPISPAHHILQNQPSTSSTNSSKPWVHTCRTCPNST